MNDSIEKNQEKRDWDKLNLTSSSGLEKVEEDNHKREENFDTPR